MAGGPDGPRRGRRPRRSAGAHIQLPAAARARRARTGIPAAGPVWPPAGAGLPDARCARRAIARRGRTARGGGGRLGADADRRPPGTGRGDRRVLPRADRHDAGGDAAARPRVARRAALGRCSRAGTASRAGCQPVVPPAPTARLADAVLLRHGPTRGREPVAGRAAPERRHAGELVAPATGDPRPAGARPAPAADCGNRRARHRSSARCSTQSPAGNGRCPSWPTALGVEAGSLLAPARRLAARGAAELEWRDVGARPAGAPVAPRRPSRTSWRPSSGRGPGRDRGAAGGRRAAAGGRGRGRQDRRLPRGGGGHAGEGSGRDRARAGGQPRAAAGRPGARPRSAPSWRCCTPACRPGSVTTSGCASCAARRGWWSAPGPPSSLRSPIWG